MLVANNSGIMRRPLRALVESEPRIKLLGEAQTLSELLGMSAALQLHVIILDIDLHVERNYPPQFLKFQLSGSRIVALSAIVDEKTKTLADSLGASALLDKYDFSADLIPVILGAA